MRHTYNFLLIILLFAVCGCSRKTKLDTLFYEVEKHYNSTNDTLKRRAAEYLHKYATFHYGIKQMLVDSTGQEIQNINPLSFKSDTAYRYYLNKNKINFVNSKLIYDADTLTKEFIISNIDLAFDSWQNNYWSANINFKDFCTYILSYRNANEELSQWRGYFKEKYEQRIKDSLGDCTDIKKVALFMMKELKNDVKYGTRLRDFYINYMTPEMSEKMHTMECIALAHYGTLALRACGIPCAMIEAHWRFTETSHTSILLPKMHVNDSAYRLSIYDEIQVMGMPKDSMASWRTWQYSYEVNDDLLKVYENNPQTKNLVFPFSRQDITDIFSKTHDIAMQIPPQYSDCKNLFLCRFSFWNWYPIREGFVNGDSVYFKNATIKQLYRLAHIEQDGTCNVFGDVFSINGFGDIVKYNCTGDTTLFKIAYNCTPEETIEEKDITSFYWSSHNQLTPLTKRCRLWGFNEKTIDYKPYTSELAGKYKPVFYLYEANMPCWTFFYDENLPRPLGYIPSDNTEEAYLIQF